MKSRIESTLIYPNDRPGNQKNHGTLSSLDSSMKWLIAKHDERETYRAIEKLGGYAIRMSWHPFRSRVLSVNLRDTKASDENLNAFASLPSLSLLELGYTNITDAGVQTLARHPNLNYLFLWGNSVSNECLTTLATIPLSLLNVASTQITLTGCMKLSEKLSDCLICHSRENTIFRGEINLEWPYRKWLDRDENAHSSLIS